MTLDLQGDQDAQGQFSRWLAGFPLFAAAEKFWIEPAGARCLLSGIPGEIDLGFSVADGALLIEFEAVREKAWYIPGTLPIEPAAWQWKVAEVVRTAKLAAPPWLTLTLVERVLRVEVAGWVFARVLVSHERLILEAIPDA